MRSGLVSKPRLFSEKESADLYRCVGFAKANCETLTYEQERLLDKLQEKLTDAYPSLEAEPPTFEQESAPQQNILIDGQFEINESVNICLNGKKIRAGSSIPENRYMLTVKGSNALTITDCGGNGTIVGADTKGISVTQDATLTMYGGTIRDFLCGVGVSGTFRMTGNAHITACRESGISLHGAYGRGTQVYLSGNAAVTDCVSSASGSGAGIHINSGSTLFLSGNIRFSGNRYQNPDTGETWGDDILIDYGAIWSFVSNPRKYEYPPVRINGTLDKDLQISFNVGWNLQEAMATRIKTNPVRLIGGENYTLTAADLTHFITTRNAWEGYIFAYDEETSGIVMRLDHYHCVCGGNTAVGDHTSHIDMGWAPWAGTDDLPCNYNSVIYSTIKDGYWYLTDDVTLDREYNGSFPDCMRLCLHGKTITLTENACIKITKGELIITDCTGQGKIVFPKDGIAVEKKYQAGKLTLFGGTIRGSANGDSDRTGIRVMNGAEFLMYGGVIEKFGHGVGAEGAFTMYGGTIRDCHVIGNGGGVLVSTGGAFLMKGGSIKDCSAWNGGGICADGGTLTLAGGTISECSAITAGGGIATFDFTAFELGGTVISDCEAWQGGGVRSLSSSAQAVMTGGKITGCRSTDPRCNALYLGDNIDFRALGGRIEGTVCTADGTKITGSATGTIFTDVVYHAFNAGTFSGLRFEGNGRIVYEYRVYYYSASGILLYINNENAGDVYGDGTVSYDDAAKTLTLNGVTLTGQQMLGATDLPDTLTVVLIGNNVFENDKRGMQDRTSRNQERIRQIDREIADLGAKNHIIARLHTSGAMNAADYAMQTSEIGNRLTELRIERRQKLTEDENDQLLATLKDLNGILDEYEPTVEFDNGLFDEIVESITVDSSEQLTFKLIGGIALTEQIPKKGR